MNKPYKQYIRNVLLAGLCVATTVLCMPPQTVFAVTEGVVAADPEEIDAAIRTETVGYDSVTISWNPMAGATVYELQQSEDKTNYTSVAVVAPDQELRATAMGLYTGKTYYYRVVSRDEAGVETMTDSLKAKTVLPAPTLTRLEPSASDRIELAWTEVEGAAFYRVYRSLTATGGYKSVKTVYGTSYSNKVKTNTKYYYKIMPLRYNPDGKKVRGKCSTPQSVTAREGVPVIASVTNSGNNSLTVNWGTVTGAEGYAVYRSLEKASGYQLIKELGSDSLSWTDTTVEAGTKYFYKVSSGKLTNGVISYGIRSASKSKWTKSDAPSALSVVQNGSGAAIQWSPSKAASSYRVYRAQGTDTQYTRIASKIMDCSYTDTGLMAGETYSYRIEAVHGTLVSEKSQATTITIGEIQLNTRTLFVGMGVTAPLSVATELPGTVIWNSEDPAVATVDEIGNVTGVACGKTTVTAEVDGVVANVTVTVTDCEINGIDVSKWQQAINWEKVKASGIRFAILRLTYGTSVDMLFEKYYSGATAQGIDVGAYCYTRATKLEEGIAEADNLVKLLDGRELGYPVALDLEDDLQLKNMTKAERTELILEYKRIIEEAGYDFVVYANLNWLTNYIDQKQLAAENVDIWIARYRDQSLGHGYTGGGNVRIWQYSSTGQVDGILDTYGRYINVDLDVCYEDY